MARASEPERLQKVLSRLGVASRREAEQWIRAGRLSINGRAASLGDKVGQDDQLRLDGRLIRQARAAAAKPVLLCHRSPGIALLARAGEADSVASRLPRRTGERFMSISPLPQVDGGLELLSADGGLASRLQRAMRAQLMVYSLRVRGELTEEQQRAIGAGQLDRGSVLKVLAIAAAGGTGANRWYQIDTLGASGNDLRQLLERAGVSVSRLLRIRVGALQLERSLPRGHWRELTAEEIGALLNPVAPAETPAVAPGSPGSAR
ncbi:MAG TPA: S4 domain-containing protein [Steroidobacteraceae bacterium]|nr:S4 domain-containing protein [Steroidobacteraceae bacterium]